MGNFRVYKFDNSNVFTIKECTIITANLLVMLERMGHRLGDLNCQQEKYYHFFLIFIYLWLRWVFVAARGLFSTCQKWELLFLAERRLLIAVASLFAEHRLQ